MRDEDVAAWLETRLGQDRRQHVARGTWRDGGLQHNQVAATQQWRDVAGGLLHVGQVGALRQRIERCRHGDDERVGGGGTGLDA